MRIKKNDLQNAIIQKAGLISYIARGLNVSRAAVYRAIKRYKLEVILDEARETTLDLAESQLYNSIKEGNMNAVFFYLKTIGRKRGYADKEDIEEKGKIMIVLDNHDNREERNAPQN